MDGWMDGLSGLFLEQFDFLPLKNFKQSNFLFYGVGGGGVC